MPLIPLNQKTKCSNCGAALSPPDARTGVASFLEHGPGKATFTGR